MKADGGNFVKEQSDGSTRYFGNFIDVSHVFSIVTDDSEIVASLTPAIRANQERPGHRLDRAGGRQERDGR